MSPSLAALIASQTASGVKAAALRVSARTVLGSNPSAAMRKNKANNHRNLAFSILIVVSPGVV
jgi:hypothetical protein